MLNQLYRRLSRFYVITTGVILTLLFCFVWIYQGYLENVRRERLFQNYVLELTNKLETDTYFSDSWLARMEADNRLIVHIEENGVPLFFPGSWKPATERRQLIARIKEEALRQNLDTSQPPLFASIKKTDLLTIRGEHKDRYLGMVLMISSQTSYKTLILLQEVSGNQRNYLFQGLGFLLLDGTGILLLSLLGRKILKEAIKPVVENQKKQEEFVAAASHELRSPLSVIQTSAQAAVRDPQKAPSLLLTVQNECQRAGKLIQNLLLLASSDSRQIAVRPTEVDTLLLRLYELYEPVCHQKGIQLRLQLPQECLPEADTETDTLFQILTILMENAVAHGCGPKASVREITICAEPIKKGLRISIRDRGPGISPAQKEKIFLRFYRGDPSRNKKEHFGLGLSVAAALAPLAAASLAVSDNPGGGACFEVKLEASSPLSKH